MIVVATESSCKDTTTKMTTTKHVTKEEAIAKTLEIVGDSLSATSQVEKYYLVDEHGHIESTPMDMWRHLARSNAIAETPELQREYEEKFYELLRDYKFVPGGRILMGLGNTYANVTLKNCYVIGILEDSIKGIFEAAHKIAETLKGGGGVGTDISILRPRGSAVKNAARFSTGAVSFMPLFSQITGMIGQKARIGAMLISIDISHPDIEEFIEIKGSEDLEHLRFANISIKISDEFMKCVENDLPFDLRWGGKVYKTVKARELWGKIVHYAWKRAEPGLLFWDETCRTYPAHQYHAFRCLVTNPCGELALSHADSCCLGSMVLSKYVRNSFEKNASFDFVAFDHDVRLGVRFLDNIISLEKTPLPEQQWANDNGRRLGLGFMGLADMLMRMRIKFDSDHAIELAEKVSQQLMTSSYDASCDLAQEKGAFPVFDYSTHMNSEFIKKLPRQILERIKKTGLRNIGLNAIAPTGTISCVAQCSSSLEPVFALKYTRRTNLGTAKEVKEYEVFPAVVQEYMHKFDCKFENLPDFFIGAHSIHPKYRIKLQATVQKYIDQSISNTVNLPMDCKEEDIAYYYFEAWKQGIKGITVYREGSREGVLLTEKKHETGEIQIHQSPRRPDVLDSVVHIIKPNGRTFTVFVGLLNGRVFEVFALDHKVAALTDGMQGKIIKHAGADGMNTYCFESGAVMVQKLNKFEDDEMSLLTRLISTSLRHGTPIEFIVDQICKSKITIKSPGKAIAHALSKYMKQEEIQGKFKCPKCNSSNMKFEGLCKTCLDCNWSRCG